MYYAVSSALDEPSRKGTAIYRSLRTREEIMKLYRLSLLLLAVISSFSLMGCGRPITIPSGAVGRQLTTAGLESKVYAPSTMRLYWCPIQACPSMVILHTGLTTEEVTVSTVFLPKSNVDLSDVKLAIQFRVKPTVEAENEIYKNVTSVPSSHEAGIRDITADMVYKIYLQRIAPNVMISVLRDYTVEEALSNVDKISEAVLKALQQGLKNQPVEIVEVGFPNGIGHPPKEVLDAKRNLYVVAENVTRKIRELEGALRVEQQRQIVQQLRVQNDVANAKTAGLDVGRYIFLKNMERFADEHVPLGFLSGFSGATTQP